MTQTYAPIPRSEGGGRLQGDTRDLRAVHPRGVRRLGEEALDPPCAITILAAFPKRGRRPPCQPAAGGQHDRGAEQRDRQPPAAGEGPPHRGRGPGAGFRHDAPR